MIKKFFVFLIGLFLIAPFILTEGIHNESKQSQQPQVTETENGCFITYIEGAAFFQNFTKAEVDMEILPGDELITRRGRIETYLGNGNFLRMDRNTRVAFVKLGEKATSLGIWNGSVYLAINTVIEVQAPDQNFVLNPGLYRIDIEKDRTKVYQNPRVADNFDSWSYDRDNEINHPATTETGYLHNSYGLSSYWSWRWYFLYQSWCWSPYRYCFYLHYQYYNSYRQHYSQHRTPVRTPARTTVRKNQLQAPSQIKSPTLPSRINRSSTATQAPRINSSNQSRTKILTPQIRAPQSQIRRSVPRSFSRPMARPIQKRIVRKK